MNRCAFATLSLVVALLWLPSPAVADAPPGEYSYSEAVTLGLISADDFQRPENMPDCPAMVPGPYLGEGADDPEPPDEDAPSCFMPPETQDIIVIVPGPDDLPFSVPGPAVSTHRYSGVWTERAFGLPLYQGGKARMQVSNPTICHGGGCSVRQHFYSRIALDDGTGTAFEAGWAELNDQDPSKTKCRDADVRRIVSVRVLADGRQFPMCHRVFGLVDGRTYTFRARQCGDPGVYRVCAQIWDPYTNPPQWRTFSTWANHLSCQNPDGSSVCAVQFLHEAASTAAPTFFDLGTPWGGLLMRNIRVRTAPGQWPLLDNTPGAHWWPNPAPYSTGCTFAYYRFRTFYGDPGSC